MTIKDKIQQFIEAESAVPFYLVSRLIKEYDSQIDELERRNHDEDEIERIVSENAGL